MQKKILYLDMDDVIANFSQAMRNLSPGLEIHEHVADYAALEKKVDEICEANPFVFHTLEPIEGAIPAAKELFDLFEVYFLSSPMWNVPESFIGKRLWIEKHFGKVAEKRLILSCRKDLHIGEFLVDDRIRNGVDKFKGIHIHFGTEKFPNWEATLPHLKTLA